MKTALRARLHRFRLDQDLADGVRPDRSPEHTLRAQQLVSPRSRCQLAKGLESALAASERPRPLFTAAVELQVGEIRAARGVLMALVRRLRDDLPVRARGVALVRVLLSDGASPLYRASRPGALEAWAHTALRSLPPPAHHFVLPR